MVRKNSNIKVQRPTFQNLGHCLIFTASFGMRKKNFPALVPFFLKRTIFGEQALLHPHQANWINARLFSTSTLHVVNRWNDSSVVLWTFTIGKKLEFILKTAGWVWKQLPWVTKFHTWRPESNKNQLSESLQLHVPNITGNKFFNVGLQLSQIITCLQNTSLHFFRNHSS